MMREWRLTLSTIGCGKEMPIPYAERIELPVGSAAEPLGPGRDLAAESTNLRFSLRDLFIVTTVAAAFLALLRALGILEQSLRGLAALFAGVLAVGFFMALLAGLVMAPWAAFGVFFFGIGLLAFTPLFTAFAYWRQMKQAAAIAGSQPQNGWLAAAGLIMAIAIPLAVGILTVNLLQA